ncbi:MAG: hypothetical protein FD167_1430 [bacterium]|nr:MAG: hypothetical protein FD167_1430 [bacterium]
MLQRIYDAKETLADLELACKDIQTIRIANLTNIEGRKAEFPDGTKHNVNVAVFESQEDISKVRDDLKFVKKEDATVGFIAQMAKEGRAQIGGDMFVFVEDKDTTILIFGK